MLLIMLAEFKRSGWQQSPAAVSSFNCCYKFYTSIFLENIIIFHPISAIASVNNYASNKLMRSALMDQTHIA